MGQPSSTALTAASRAATGSAVVCVPMVRVGVPQSWPNTNPCTFQAASTSSFLGIGCSDRTELISVRQASTGNSVGNAIILLLLQNYAVWADYFSIYLVLDIGLVY